MAAKATVSQEYRLRRLGGFTLLFLVAGLWFLKDGFITYPRQQEMYEAFQRLSNENRLVEDWPALAASKGWPTEVPKEKPRERKWLTDILVQRVLGIALTPPGLLFLYYFLASFRRWIATDEAGLLTSSGLRVPYGQITSINKRLWTNKGIAYVRYTQDGKERRVRLDDWEYDQEATKQIVLDIESHLKPEQIVDGPASKPSSRGSPAGPPSSESTPA